MTSKFDYLSAFSRNLGWLTEQEQWVLREKRIAIAGLGGVGGSHLLTLTRLGIGRFHVSDLDVFELANFNRQAGASLSHVGRAKVNVLTEMARDINPDLDIRTFPEGINAENLDRFLDGVDLYVDGLDFFAVAARRMVFDECTRRGIPAVTAAPLGMGVALLNFLPGRMSFEEYFRLDGQTEDEQLLRFLLGLSPAMLQMPYLVDDTRVDLDAHKGPSTPMACDLCAGFAATQAVKILLHRGGVVAAPRGLHFDAYRGRYVTTWRPAGNRHPLQRLGLMVARRRLGAAARAEVKPAIHRAEGPGSPLERVLDLARWAPSGDNTQPWRFEILDERRFTIHARDTRDWCVYDLEGRASQIAVGALLETIEIAASAEGCGVKAIRRLDAPEDRPVIEVELLPQPDLPPSPLLPFIRVRATQRRPLATRTLGAVEKEALARAVGPGYRVLWMEGAGTKWTMAKLLYRNAGIRLTIPEAYRVHKDIIEWNARFSEDRIPDQAVGLDSGTLKLMKWAMASWGRVSFLNRYLAGTVAPRLQLDLLPALRCGAHFVLVGDRPLATIDDYMAGGRALQRFWLGATRLGLQVQPEMTPLIFSSYVARSIKFTGVAGAGREAAALRAQLVGLVGGEALLEASVFLGRVGWGVTPRARSLRLPLARLRQAEGASASQ